VNVQQRRWLLLDYAGVISHQPSAADWAALRHATGWTTDDQLALAYWTPRSAYDLGEQWRWWRPGAAPTSPGGPPQL
jgi:hypothetical protein